MLKLLQFSIYRYLLDFQIEIQMNIVIHDRHWPIVFGFKIVLGVVKIKGRWKSWFKYIRYLKEHNNFIYLSQFGVMHFLQHKSQ